MKTHSHNPYQPPEMAADDAPPTGTTAETGWKQIAKRWEMLRIPFNVIVGLTGVLMLAILPTLAWQQIAVGVVAYGFMANVMYLLGPIGEMYINWLVDALEKRIIPSWLARFVRSSYLTALLFLGGSLFSVGVTLIAGLSQAFAAAVANQ
jgi:hypothetical protein